MRVQTLADKIQRVLALDPATNMGWAYNTDDDGVRFGVVSLEGVDVAARLESLFDLIVSTDFDVIAYEDAPKGAGRGKIQSAAFANQVQAIILLGARKIGAKAVPVNPGTVKKFATGHGKADKATMVRAANCLLGPKYRFPWIDDKQHDAADALWVLEWYKHHAIMSAALKE